MKDAIKQAIKAVVGYIPAKVRARKRHQQLASERHHYAKADLLADLQQLPIAAGATVLVHSSLKAIGFVEGGPDAVVAALAETVVEKGQGTLMFPTYSIQGTMHNTLISSTGKLVFDVAQTRSNLGAIPEAFRLFPGVLRSVHPTHSFAAIGPRSTALTAHHQTCGNSFGLGSPMANLLDHESYLLGLGTDLGHVTFYHCLEGIEPDFPFNVYTEDSPLAARCKDHSGQIATLNLSVHDQTVAKTRIDRPENEVVRNFYTQHLEQNAGMTWHTVCDAKCWLVRADRLYAVCKNLLAEGITIYSTERELQERGLI